MSYPENPETIILRNKFYPKGLREIDIWSHYQKVKGLLLREVVGRDLLFFIFVDVNKPIIKRKGKTTNFIRLTSSNYDEMITGRTVSIHSAMRRSEDFGIIDIDIDPTDQFRWAKRVTMDVYNIVMTKIPIVDGCRIKFSGKHSFHIICEFGRKINVDSIRFLLRKFLQDSELSKRYTIEGRRRPGVPNLDLSPNKMRGNYIALHALSIWGLQSMEVPYRKLMGFDQHRAVVRRSS